MLVLEKCGEKSVVLSRGSKGLLPFTTESLVPIPG